MYVWVSFPQISSPKSCTCLSLPPNALHAPPISFFLILSLTQYWVFCLSQVLLSVLHSSVFPTWNCLDICKTVITLSTFMFVLSLGTLSHLILSFDPACKHFDGHDLLFFLSRHLRYMSQSETSLFRIWVKYQLKNNVSILICHITFEAMSSEVFKDKYNTTSTMRHLLD